MKLKTLFFGVLLIGATAQLPVLDIIHEKRNIHNTAWIKREPMCPDSIVRARIALKQRNLENGMQYLLEVSDPDSPSYGQHYTKEDVNDIFAPTKESISSVKDWLLRSGIRPSSVKISRSKGWMDFDAPVSQLESLFNTSYHVFEHSETAKRHVGVDQYRLPPDISQHVDFVKPGVVFTPIRDPAKGIASKGSCAAQKGQHVSREFFSKIVKPQGHSGHASAENCDKIVTPACIMAMYNIPPGASAHPNNTLGIYGQYPDIYRQSDLDLFYDSYAPWIKKGTGPIVRSINVSDTDPQQSDFGEANLDLEIAIPIVFPQQVQWFDAYLDDLDDQFESFLEAIDGSYCTSAAGRKSETKDCGTFQVPNVVSFSYGLAEVDRPTAYMERQCNEFMKLGLQGVSIVFSSGDSGVASRTGPCLGPNYDIYAPLALASCPYVTAVGGTLLPNASRPGDPEVASDEFSSGGGFSNIWTTPSYQRSAIDKYFAEHDPGYKHYNTSGGKVPTTGGIYNRAGRAYPDVAAVGEHIASADQNSTGTTYGTSASAPLIAAIFNRINEERLSAGKGPIGFANPAIYKNPSMFRDVTVGNQSKGGNRGDFAPSACGNNGFSAVSGWDPVTGWGVPKYPELLGYFLNL